GRVAPQVGPAGLAGRAGELGTRADLARCDHSGPPNSPSVSCGKFVSELTGAQGTGCDVLNRARPPDTRGPTAGAGKSDHLEELTQPMPTDSIWLFTASVVAYFVVLLVPGLAVGLAAGLRGWTLAGLAPLFGYTVHGLTGPWLSGLGFAYTLWSALIATALFAAVVYAIRRYVENRWPERERPQQGLLPNWGRNAHLGVILCIGIAFVVSSVVLIAAAEGELDAIPQRWDPVFHANGIRYIAETGDGGLYGVSSVNRYGPEGSQFYPNAYHLAGSLVYMITGATVPTVINAMTLPIAGLFGLSMAALVRECGGRSVLAGAAALTAAAVNSGVYESSSNGLVPFALSTAFTPLAPMIMHRYLVRPNVTNGMVLVLAAAGLLVVHSSALFAGLLFAVPMLIHRWWTESSTIGKDIKHLLPD